MRRSLLVSVVVVLCVAGTSSQGKPVLVINPFTTSPGVELPYDIKMMQSQLVAEFKVLLGKQFEIAPEKPASAAGAVYTLDAEITGWRAGNAAKRLLVGMGSGREASDVRYQVTDTSGTKVVERNDTIRTNFYSQHSGSTGTLAHPIAQKIADRIKDARLKE